jgi:NTE family protein
MTLRNYAGQCNVPHESAVPKVIDDSYRARLFRASEESYRNAEERPYIHLVDGGLADNLGIRAILDRLIARGSFSAGFRAATPGSIRKIILIAVNSERDLGERIDRSDRVPTTRQVVDTLLFGASGRITQTTLEMMRDDVQRWRREVAERRGLSGSPFAADAELHVVSVSLHDVEDPAVRHSILTIPTAFTIDPKEVRQLVEAGRQALRRSPEFQRLRRRLAGETVEPGITPAPLRPASSW